MALGKATCVQGIGAVMVYELPQKHGRNIKALWQSAQNDLKAFSLQGYTNMHML